MSDDIERAVAKHRCEKDHLFFTRYFFKQREGSKFRVNWHHHVIADALQDVFDGKTQNLVINVPPGSSKTEMAVINVIARGLAKNPNSRFLHLSYSDDLAVSQNSAKARDIVASEEYQSMWPRRIATDTKAKGRWNVMIDNPDGTQRKGGGVYATSVAGQVTGFRAGHMADGFQGAIIIDDPLKPEDAFSKTKLDAANRRLLTTVKSRRARPETPIIVIMQRISDGDPVKFIKDGNLGRGWKHIVIPALIDEDYVKKSIPVKYHHLLDSSVRDEKGRFSYWQFKEPLDELLDMERGGAVDKDGNLISKQVFNAQYQQSPTALGGNVIKGHFFVRYQALPKILYRKIYADTAQKTKEHNDFSVFQCWGMGADGKIYLLDQLRGKWESPDLKRQARAFWAKHAAWDPDKFGHLRQMIVEEKSSGTDLVQTIKLPERDPTGKVVAPQIPVKGLERNKDKYTRVQDALPYLEIGSVCIPEAAPFTSDFVGECEAFKADMTHQHDDQVDPMLDAVEDMLSTQNKTKVWENL